jgi:hypothetical protein
VVTGDQTVDEWLTAFLTEHGDTPRKEVLAAAEAAGFGERRVKRAAERIGVLSQRGGFPAVATWALASVNLLVTSVGTAPPPVGTPEPTESVPTGVPTEVTSRFSDKHDPHDYTDADVPDWARSGNAMLARSRLIEDPEKRKEWLRREGEKSWNLR